MNREDPFSGTWRLNPEKSDFDPNHRVSSGTMRWERIANGYSMKAEGTHDGHLVQERPATFILDGKDHGLGDGKCVAVAIGLVAHVAPRGLVVEPFAHIALANARRLGELLGGACADLRHGLVKS